MPGLNGEDGGSRYQKTCFSREAGELPVSDHSPNAEEGRRSALGHRTTAEERRRTVSGRCAYR